MDLKCFYVSVMAVLVVPVGAFQGSISITGNTEIGGNIAITCSWTLAQDENFFSVSLRSLPVAPSNPNYYYYLFNQGVTWAVPGNQSNIRMSFENFTASNNQAVVRITNVQCSDGLTYSCYFTIGRPGVQNSYYEQTSFLDVKARPKTPTISLPPNTGDDILEFSNISAVCASNVGRPGRGSLQWKIYRSSGPEVILPTDPRLDALKNVTLPQGEDSCTQRVEQTFRMNVNRDDQNLTIACFVQNDDFQSQTPNMCLNPTTDFCGQTKTLRIVYGVNETDMTVTSDPPGAVYEDMAVTLICRAAGFPTPTFTWAQVLDDNSTAAGNNTLSGELVNDEYRLVLTDLDAYRGQELKYACTASNTVLNRPISVTKEISFQVLMTTTTVRTTTTRTTPTTTTTAARDSNVTKVAESQAGKKDDDPTNTIIIVVVVVVGSILIIAIIVGIIFWRKRRSRKGVEEPSEKPSTNRTNLSYQSSQPDLVADKKFTSPSLDNSFSEKKEDGLMYADLTYDNRPRSRKPMALNDTSSEYSDIQMPQV